MADGTAEPTPAQMRGLRRLALDRTTAAERAPYLAADGPVITGKEVKQLAEALDNPPDEAELFRRIFGQDPEEPAT